MGRAGRPAGAAGQALALGREEIHAVASALGPRDRTVWMLGVLTRCRVGEILGLRVKDVWLDGEPLRYLYLSGARTKSKRARVIPLCPQAGQCIREWMESRPAARPGDWLFPGRHPGKPYSYVGFSKVLRLLAQRLGLPTLRSHSMRRSSLTLDQDLGADLTTIRGLSGHAHLSTLQVYLEKNDRKASEAADRLGNYLFETPEPTP